MQESFLAKARKLAELAQELGITMAQLSIAWCISNPDVTTAILGATRKEQLLDNLEALKAKEKLSAEVMKRIEEIVQSKPTLPEY